MPNILKKHLKPETIEKIRQKALGQNNPMYGKTHSTETKNKISLARKGKGLGNHKTGYKHSTETRTRMSIAHTGLMHSQETKQKMRLKLQGRSMSSKCKEALRQANIGSHHTENHKAKITASLIGNTHTLGLHYHLTEEERRRRGLAISTARNKPGNKAKAKKSYEKMWQNPEYRNKVVKAILLGNRIKPNKPEQQLLALLNELYPNQWEYTGDGKLIIDGKNPDFWNGDHRLIELFGDYWHKGEDPQDKINHYEQYDYKCLVIWEKELRYPDNVSEKINEFMAF